MLVIGLTGSIGTGKSTVAGMLQKLGAVVIDADKVTCEVLEPGNPVWQQLVAEFGPGITGEDRQIDRPRLAKIVFENEKKRQALNRITHPAMKRLVQEKLQEYRKNNIGLVVLEAPLLIEGGWTDLVDEVWVTVAPRPSVLKRLKKRSGMPEAEALARINSQSPEAEKRRYADVVINTDLPLEELGKEIERLLTQFKFRHRR